MFTLRYALFDLDDTLYGAECGLWDAIGDRINLFIQQKLGLASDAAGPMRQRYLESYGTTLNGLRAEHGINADDYLLFVHDLPLSQYLHPNPALDQMLARLQLTKAVFTNSDAPHARRVLGCLGVEKHFSQIVDIHAVGFVSKPDPRAYQRALDMLGAAANETVFVDDALRNLVPARTLGMTTVLVRSGGPKPESVDFQIGSILELEQVLASGEAASL